MRWLALITFCCAVVAASALPEPKKYKTEIKDNKSNSSLTSDEKTFLREVEQKFGIKSEVPIEKEINSTNKTPFPAVIAIEIVNDTNTNSKDKRTIDANLGYGYRTNNGYTYSYFGKPTQEKGKFMIYPYSQEDIPPARPNYQRHPGYTQSNHLHKHSFSHTRNHNKYTTPSTNVEIQPSQAYELVPVNEGQTSNQAKQVESEYTKPQSHVAPTPTPYAVNENQEERNSGVPQTLYTTYNGGHLSGLSGQFPSVMSSYLVDPSQLLHNPQYQSVGLTSDHLRSHGSQIDQRVVPVLVLRVPSSYLKNPSAELYANLPSNYPHSQYLNSVNIQELVNQYFKNIGYSHAPQVMTYQSPISVSSPTYEPQHYAAPQVNPTYTHSDYSGIQYSGVQPVMVKYPVSDAHEYSNQQFYIPQSHAMYQHAMQSPQYEYQYQYVQPTQAYYYPQYQTTSDQHGIGQQEQTVQETPTEYEASQDYESSKTSTQYTLQNEPHAEYGPAKQDPTNSADYSHQSKNYDHYSVKAAADYGPTKVSLPVHDDLKSISNGASSLYNAPKSGSYQEQNILTSNHRMQQNSAGYGAHNTDDLYNAQSPSTYEASSEHSSGNAVRTQYVSQKESPSEYTSNVQKTVEYGAPSKDVQKETIAIFPSHAGRGYNYQVHHSSGPSQNSMYQKYVEADTESKNLPISENYPTKDHTHVTILPQSYKSSPKQSSATVQGVNYVTPVPFSTKYHHQYRVMVPQLVLNGPEKVTYVNSHSIPSHYAHVGSVRESSNPEEEYKLPSDYVPPVGSQKPPAFPRNYHSHKRMAKNDSKHNTNSAVKKERQPENKKDSTKSI